MSLHTQGQNIYSPVQSTCWMVARSQLIHLKLSTSSCCPGAVNALSYNNSSSFGRGNWQGVRASTLHSWCKKVGELIDVPLHPHDFRHSGATLLKNMGMSLEDVSTLLNHAGTDVTRKHYIKEDKSKLQGIKDKFGI